MTASFRDVVQVASWTATTTPRDTSANLDWQAGDKIIVLGSVGDESSTLDTPTASGLTFSLISGMASNNPTGNMTDVWAWEADAAGSGSQLINVVRSAGASAFGIIAFAIQDHDGLGATLLIDSTDDAQTMDFTTQRDGSIVIFMASDWQGNEAGAGTAVGPAGSTERVDVSGATTHSVHIYTWTDIPAGLDTYGYSGTANATSAKQKIAIEVMSPEAPAPAPTLRTVSAVRRLG